MASVGSLTVNLRANTAKFKQDMRQSTKEVQTFGSRVRKAFASARTGFFAVAAAAAATTLVFRKLSADIDSTAKVADKLGATIQELTTLRQAAAEAGVAATTLDMAIQRMTRRLSEAAIGTGEAQGAIKELGLDAKALRDAGPLGALVMIADAMKQVESQADKVRLSFKLFDSEGVALVNIIGEGSDKLREMEGFIDGVGTISRSAAAEMEQLNDAMSRLGTTISETSKRGAGRVATFLNPLIEALGEARRGAALLISETQLEFLRSVRAKPFLNPAERARRINQERIVREGELAAAGGGGLAAGALARRKAFAERIAELAQRFRVETGRTVFETQELLDFEKRITAEQNKQMALRQTTEGRAIARRQEQERLTAIAAMTAGIGEAVDVAAQLRASLDSVGDLAFPFTMLPKDDKQRQAERVAAIQVLIDANSELLKKSASAQGIIDKFRVSLAGLGDTAGERAIAELRRLGDPDQIRDGERLIRQYEDMARALRKVTEEEEASRDKADKFRESLKTDAERLREELSAAAEAAARGFLTPEEAIRTQNRLAEEGRREERFGLLPAAVQGSLEAFRLLQGAKDPLLNINGKIAKNTEKTNRLLEQQEEPEVVELVS